MLLSKLLKRVHQALALLHRNNMAFGVLLMFLLLFLLLYSEILWFAFEMFVMRGEELPARCSVAITVFLCPLIACVVWVPLEVS